MRYIYVDASTQNLLCIYGNDKYYKEYSLQTNMDLVAHLPYVFELLTDYHKKESNNSVFGELEGDLLCLCTGPGSLTGLRVALSFFRTIAFIKKIPVVGIDLYSLGEYKLQKIGFNNNVNILIPAFLDHYFCLSVNLSHFNKASAKPKPKLIHSSEISSEIENYGINFNSNSMQKEIIDLKIDNALIHEYILKNFANINYNFDMLLNILPTYIIPSQAEIKWKNKYDNVRD